MTLRIGTNSASLMAQRQLGKATQSLSRTLERLSSGLRINHASDDAAGLSIASSLKTESRLYTHGIRNANDGISLLHIADGALAELTNITTRIQELAEQASNGTYSNEQRAAMDAEAQALAAEYGRIASVTEFNGLKLLDGSNPTITLQVGTDGTANSQISINLGAVGTDTSLGNDGTFQASVSQTGAGGNDFVGLGVGDFNEDGELDLLSTVHNPDWARLQIGNGDGTFGAPAIVSAVVTDAYTVSVADIDGDGHLDAVLGSRNAFVSDVFVLLGNGDGTFEAAVSYDTGALTPEFVQLVDINGDGKLDIVTEHTYTGYTTVNLGNGDGTFAAGVSYGHTYSNNFNMALADLDEDGKLDLITPSTSLKVTVRLGQAGGTFGGESSYNTSGAVTHVVTGDFNNDGHVDVIATDISRFEVFYGDGTGTLSAAVSYSTSDASTDPNDRAVAAIDLNNDGYLDFVQSASDTGDISIYWNNGDGTFNTTPTQITTEADVGQFIFTDLDGNGALDLIAGGSSVIYTALGNASQSASSGSRGLPEFSLLTISDARAALELMADEMSALTAQRGNIGASISRLEFAISNNYLAKENVESAYSQIMDADIAEESAKLLSQQILQQAATAILAQANQQPQLALKLLEDI